MHFIEINSVVAIRTFGEIFFMGTSKNDMDFYCPEKPTLGGGFKDFLFSPLLGEMI